MTDVAEIRLIPVNDITVLNPRARNKRVFQELVTSIEHLGLKRPITVSQRPGRSRYDLVCGQGRLEAFIALGQEQIPAVLIDAAEEDCFVMSLVENLARRQHTPLELVRAIGSLRERGYSHSEIAAKVDYSTEYVGAICHLLENGEEKLISAVERGVIPHTVAMEIAHSKEGEVQRALAQAFEEKAIPGNSGFGHSPHYRATQHKRQRDPQSQSWRPQSKTDHGRHACSVATTRDGTSRDLCQTGLSDAHASRFCRQRTEASACR